ncbi:MAG: CtsR family transcriptional regulator, partial [Clostridiales bacterium]|nr:CtsR family transcriptional regulator [Clostridiales bacterium]
MGISDLIAGFIGELLTESDGSAEIQRAELANRFNCVPSQINYVISTRFSPEHGYIVESRRGGNGYIRITRVKPDPERLVMHTVNVVGDELDIRTSIALIGNLLQSGSVSAEQAKLLLAATGVSALRGAPRE